MNILKILLALSLVFIFSSTGLVIILFPLVKSEFSYQLMQLKLNKQTLITWFVPSFQIIVQPEINRDFGIWIEKINISSIVYANVDASNPQEYKAILMKGVAHAKGSAFPGEGSGNIYLFAHSTDTTFNIARYNAVFFLLRKLVVGDQVVIYYQGKRYVYQIFDKMILEANDNRFFTRGNGPEQLVLQTCWPPGTTWKRLILLGKPI
jgi:LPXTG-site transpeptidase (sortase) family protein